MYIIPYTRLNHKLDLQRITAMSSSLLSLKRCPQWPFAATSALFPDTSWQLCPGAFIMYSSSPALDIVCQASKLTNESKIASATGRSIVLSALPQFDSPYQDSGDAHLITSEARLNSACRQPPVLALKVLYLMFRRLPSGPLSKSNSRLMTNAAALQYELAQRQISPYISRNSVFCRQQSFSLTHQTPCHVRIS